MKLIKDKHGNITDCPQNRYILGYWKSFWKLSDYKRNLGAVCKLMHDVVYDVLESIVWLPVIITFQLLFWIYPIIIDLNKTYTFKQEVKESQWKN